MKDESGSAAPRASFQFDLPAWSLIVANLVPLAGAIFLGWDAGIILVTYWAENLVVGFYTVLRMILAHAPRPTEHLAKIFLVPFFLVHFGGFCAIHGIFVFTFVQGLERAGPELHAIGDPEPWWGPFMFIGLLVNVIRTVWEVYSDTIWISVIALFISHGVSFVSNYLLKGEYLRRTSKTLMAGPYGRIVVMHIAIIAAGLPVLFFGSPLPLLVILIALKILVDFLLYQAAHHVRPTELLTRAETRSRK